MFKRENICVKMLLHHHCLSEWFMVGVGRSVAEGMGNNNLCQSYRCPWIHNIYKNHSHLTSSRTHTHTPNASLMPNTPNRFECSRHESSRHNRFPANRKEEGTLFARKYNLIGRLAAQVDDICNNIAQQASTYCKLIRHRRKYRKHLKNKIKKIRRLSADINYTSFQHRRIVVWHIVACCRVAYVCFSSWLFRNVNKIARHIRHSTINVSWWLTHRRRRRKITTEIYVSSARRPHFVTITHQSLCGYKSSWNWEK